MNDSGYQFWGRVRSLGVRLLLPDQYFAAVTFSGGDAGDSWTSYAFLHVTDLCTLTPLAKVYESVHEESLEKCSGKLISYRFVSDTIRTEVICDRPTGVLVRGRR